ncbi:MAG: hypothetical protein IPM64_16610 [Phycisphaerales bacterium]|nr:hypothetical protein [Phycisphaerales bacterium]
MPTASNLWTRLGSFFRPTNGNGAHPGESFGGLLRPRSRNAVERVGEMMSSLERHFDAQDRRAEQLAVAVERVGALLEELARTQQAQEGSLRAIVQQMEVSGRATSEALSRLPQTLSAQGDSLRSIARQLEGLQESDSQLVISLQKFGGAADALNASGAAQVAALQRLHETSAQRHAESTTLMRDQQRRMWMIVGGLMISVLAVGLGGAAVMLALRAW